MFKYVLLAFSMCLGFTYFGQISSSELFVQAQKFQSLKRVLYIAAHPDDENTRALAWLSLGEKAETAYLSLTRGDGGQNLIGNELGAELGLLRSQELLQARSIDGSRQFFSRAVDFGFSRSAEESFNKWNKDEVLSDVVAIIRQFKPDVIIARFPPDERAGHGHHTASALLAIEAFEKAADPNFLPNQVKQFGVWKTKSVYWNASNWWNKGIDSVAKNNPEYLTFDIGGYNPLLGQSYNEIGTLARSQHKCQGFGSVVERGSRIEYFQYLAGEKLKDSFFTTTSRKWETITTPKLKNQMDQLIATFDFRNTANNVPQLLAIYSQLSLIKDDFLREEKQQLCKKLIADCLGLYMDVTADDYSFTTNQDITLQLNMVNRSNQAVSFVKATSNDVELKSVQQSQVLTNEMKIIDFVAHPKAAVYNPYWLEDSYSNLYAIKNQSDLGKPTSAPSINLEVVVSINGVQLAYTLAGEYKWSDPSYGERRRELISTPNFTVNVDDEVVLVAVGQSKKIRASIHNFSKSLQDTLLISVPNGWEIDHTKIPLHSTIKHQIQWVEFTVIPTEKAVNGTFTFTDSKGVAVHSFKEIAYDHIPTQVLFSKVNLPLKKLAIAINKGKIGYIKGVQEGVPSAIARMGFDVTLLDINDLSTADLSVYQSIVIGIRAYNVIPELLNYNDKLNAYVEQGGNLIVQYNTASNAVKEMVIGPIPFQIGRDRVTEEDSKVTLLEPTHQMFNYPNKIENHDFDDWVQERGLYFADKYEAPFISLISWNDTGKNPAIGGLIVAKYGKGQMVYTGISFFRQLPSGVEGAYKLFANMLSYKKTR